MDTKIIPIPRKSIKDITGQIFGRLTVLGFVGTEKGYSYWLCQCTCGKTIKAKAALLNSGTTQSCGCYQRDRFLSAVKGKTTTHGKANKIPEYEAWKGIRRRCRSSAIKCYANYGGRGIRVCSGWNDFANFLSDMGSKPTARHSIDRIDVNGHYSCGHCEECRSNNWPSNCAWATPSEQCNNKRTNIVYEFDGQKLTMKQWASKIGMNYQTLVDRLEKGMTIEDALTTPIDKSKHNALVKRPSAQVVSKK